MTMHIHSTIIQMDSLLYACSSNLYKAERLKTGDQKKCKPSYQKLSGASVSGELSPFPAPSKSIRTARHLLGVEQCTAWPCTLDTIACGYLSSLTCYDLHLYWYGRPEKAQLFGVQQPWKQQSRQCLLLLHHCRRHRH